MLEDKVWFAVEAKSFEITAEGEGKKTKYVITERGRGRYRGFVLERKGCSTL